MIENNIEIEGARLIFRNFRGEESKFNRAGQRNFGVIIDDINMAQKLQNDGWNIKWLEPRDVDEEKTAYLNVKVAFSEFNSPSIYKVTTKNKLKLDDSSIACLDYAQIKSADLVIRPYNWELGGKTGVSAYLKTMYVVIEEDDFAQKYSDISDETPF